MKDSLEKLKTSSINLKGDENIRFWEGLPNGDRTILVNQLITNLRLEMQALPDDEARLTLLMKMRSGRYNFKAMLEPAV